MDKALTINEIGTTLDMIKDNIFRYSLSSEISQEDLINDYKNIEEIKEEFFKVSFLGFSIEEIEAVRLSIMEANLNLSILLKFKLGFEVSDEMIALRRLYGDMEEQK